MRRNRWGSDLVMLCMVVHLLAGGHEVFAGAPLKGIDVRLGRISDGSVIRTITTDDNGVVNLGVLPRGSYYLALGTADTTGRSKNDGAVSDVLVVEISGTAGQSKTYRYDRQSGAIVVPEAKDTGTEDKRATSGEKPPLKKMTFDADGEHALRVTIVKSKSNITNN